MALLQEYKSNPNSDLTVMLGVYCPACGCEHIIPVSMFDGNWESPTLDGVMDVRSPYAKGICHSYVRNGQWEFLADSTHELAGQTVAMVPVQEFTETGWAII